MEDLTINNKVRHDIEDFNVKGSPPAVAHYSHVSSIKRGSSHDLFLSGMLPFDEEGNIARDMYSQTMQILKNIANVIIGSASHYGIQLNHKEALNTIYDTIVMIDDIKEFINVNKAYEDSDMPLCCRAASEHAGLPLGKEKGIKVEIKAYAHLKP